MFDQMIAIFVTAGYKLAGSGTNPPDLGDKEYLVTITAGKGMITIGPGFSGEEGCYTNFYFSLENGDLLQHGSNGDLS